MGGATAAELAHWLAAPRVTPGRARRLARRGPLTGAAVGNSMDAQEKRNREIIEARMGRAMAGAATKEDVIAMTQNHIDEPLIINHIRSHGVAYPPSPATSFTCSKMASARRSLPSCSRRLRCSRPWSFSQHPHLWWLTVDTTMDGPTTTAAPTTIDSPCSSLPGRYTIAEYLN